MYLYGFGYVLSNGGMTLALQGQGHSTEFETEQSLVSARIVQLSSEGD